MVNLGRELNETLEVIDSQIGQVRIEASQLGIKPNQLRLSDGTWAMVPLICAKAQVLHSMAVLETGGI